MQLSLSISNKSQVLCWSSGPLDWLKMKLVYLLATQVWSSSMDITWEVVKMQKSPLHSRYIELESTLYKGLRWFILYSLLEKHFSELSSILEVLQAMILWVQLLVKHPLVIILASGGVSASPSLASCTPRLYICGSTKAIVTTAENPALHELCGNHLGSCLLVYFIGRVMRLPDLHISLCLNLRRCKVRFQKLYHWTFLSLPGTD